MEFRILGPMQAAGRGGRPVHLKGYRPRLLLATLVLEAGRVVSTERLGEAVWDDRPPTSMRTQVAIAVSGLRRAFRTAGVEADVIETVRPGYRLNIGAVRIDAEAAEEAVALARDAAGAGRPDEAAERYRAALAHWRGPVLAGLDSPIVAAGGLRWTELRLTVAEELAELELARGHHHEVTGELMALVAENPLRERLRAQLMTALARAGRQAESLNAYQEGRRILDEELGLEPGRTLRDLQEAILREDPSVQQQPVAWRGRSGSCTRLRNGPHARRTRHRRAAGLRRATRLYG
ncbi:AfsR/SARP family transcriptional regulator [Actinomadura barringtoniae]|uniref:AfsR/SARP family transcriptional regulator n=1 Tax=Actinomadura barringtoniae TaxID=1427535 RepID=A0A939PKM5_9ACTN|nr:AfsR/SARP family transcriptional regulator [Actinomadura barringtoniae]MBO2451604.1 AfsR/SARP family transcriptional regulator [Actinomadura barringtoniae]